MNSTASLLERIRNVGMQKTAAALADMSPRQRLLTKLCLYKTAAGGAAPAKGGLLTSLLSGLKSAGRAAGDWITSNPGTTAAVASGSAAATLAAMLSKKNKLRNALAAGGVTAALAGPAAWGYANYDKSTGLRGLGNKLRTGAADLYEGATDRMAKWMANTSQAAGRKSKKWRDAEAKQRIAQRKSDNEQKLENSGK